MLRVKINVTLPKDLADFVEDRVQSGDDESSDDVIGEALRALELQSLLARADKRKIREAWQEGVESGDSQPIDLEEVKAEGRRLKAGLVSPR
ncbi:MAG: type II toxin-antitoxin system ParD family antitoxin [Oxalobacteraceae bacterium]|nr:MAG: type II toxin-antitoxin system ParD family antitoxin [Oxalobacteraceae bacterium]